MFQVNNIPGKYLSSAQFTDWNVDNDFVNDTRVRGDGEQLCSK